MRRIMLFLLCCLMVIPFIAAAQSAERPAIVSKLTFTEDRSSLIGAEILVITAQGISERYPVPASFYEAGDVTYSHLAISPDLQRAVVVNMFRNEDPNNPIPPEAAIFNPQTMECCVYIQPPMDNLQDIWIGDFSEDGSQMAVSYVGLTDVQTYTFGGAMGIVDTATGEFVHLVSIEEIRDATGEEYAAITLIEEWREDGVYFVPSCYACDGVPAMDMFVWTPDTRITQTDEFFNPFGDTLALTGEMIYARQNPAYPVDNEAMGMFPPANVVEYYPDGNPLFGPEYDQIAAEVPIIYYNPDYLDLPFVQWVMDGQAFVISGNSFSNRPAILVNRDGSSMTLPDVPFDAYVLTGTVDGWLMNDFNERTLVQYTVSNGQVTETVLDQGGDYQVMTEAELGASVQAPFVTVQPDVIVPAPMVSCPGFMESRLIVGTQGRVTPGSSNRLRAEPSTTAQQVGEIPAGGVFNVIAGPQCDPAGIAWWQVEYNGLTGWTAEGQGSDYFVEPA